VAEGAHTAPVLADLARRDGIDMPIVLAVADLLAGLSSARETVAYLLSRPLRSEAANLS
jgi:glycerol-3-phosphate dehydrogenase (NAD(P)+)